ncbi:aldo/keto reductase, diketogulonate reductase (plasmid) [Salipiger abyssi]|uniref:Aldo/keto reductase, diketogulonate reductase n=1 Tax=Salipiger abyssi TaxID=1250539 RepID=A0A1P8ULY9_9RHOB|nr:aldo/keto reductase, diketogulonate reductase [Salipiger abyssi]
MSDKKNIAITLCSMLIRSRPDDHANLPDHLWRAEGDENRHAHEEKRSR